MLVSGTKHKHIVSDIVVPRWEMATAFVFVFCFCFEIKPLKGCRLWASRPIFQNQCPKFLIPGVTQGAVFSIGPKMKVVKSKSNWCQMIDHSKRRKKLRKDHLKKIKPWVDIQQKYLRFSGGWILQYMSKTWLFLTKNLSFCFCEVAVIKYCVF